jgi:hypothetical protein
VRTYRVRGHDGAHHVDVERSEPVAPARSRAVVEICCGEVDEKIHAPEVCRRLGHACAQLLVVDDIDRPEPHGPGMRRCGFLSARRIDVE